MLALPNADDCMRDLDDTGLLELFAPELSAMKGVSQGNYHFLDVWDHTLLALKNARPGDLVLSLATLFHDVGKPVTRTVDENEHIRFFGHEGESARITREVLSRLKFANAEIDAVCLLVKNHMRLMSASQVSPSAGRRLIRDLGDRLETLLDLAEADISALRPGVPVMNIPELREHLKEVVVLTPPQTLESPLSGDEIMQILTIESGPEVGRIKEELSEKVIEGELRPGDKEAARIWLLRLQNP
jgi:tRNA nucleotidyltransferase/poly(A) polymerase